MILEPQEQRLQSWLELFSSPEVGGTRGGGVSRPALSEFDRIARELFTGAAEKLGLSVRVDDAGNMYARRAGQQDELPPVVIGSHLDTVVPGGRFDGILGVAIALETVAALNDAAVSTLRPIEVVNWMGEEGARFPPAMLGSGLVTGMWDADYLHSREDPQGVRVGDALSEIGFLGSPANRLTEFFAALEVHIEQGTQLDSRNLDVGIVPVISPVRWCRVEVRGVGGHAGGPGPEGRHESLVAASRMIAAARDAALAHGSFITTVGRIEVEPGSNNVIPHVTSFALDVRGTTDEELDAIVAQLSAMFKEIAESEGVSVVVDRNWELHSVPFDIRIQELLERVAVERGVAWMPTPGQIGHDSLHLASMGPTAMLFTRTTDGVSHAESEHAPWSAIMATAGVFINAVLHLAQQGALNPTASPEAMPSRNPSITEN